MTEALWSAEHLSLAYGSQILFDDTEIAVHEGERLAVVGRNGAGKSTLLRIITGEQLPDTGALLSVRRQLRLGTVPQICRLNPEQTVAENISGGLEWFRQLLRNFEAAPLHSPEYDRLEAEINRHDAWHLENKLEVMLEKLQLTDRAGVPAGQLSGGERRRAALGRAIIAEPDLLLLDEPTNHLDVETGQWLEDFLAAYRGSCLLVTHDRCFLDRVATAIVELNHGKFYRYEGNYADFLEQKCAREELLDVMENKRRNFLRREVEWVRRSPKARLKRNLGRMRRYEETAAIAAPEHDREVELIIPPPPRLGNLVVTLKQISFGYEGGREIIRNFDFAFQPGDHIGLIGVNGIGKSTLVKLITGDLTPTSGSVSIAPTVIFNYIDQMRSEVDPEKTVYEEISEGVDSIPFGSGKVTVWTYLRRFLFEDERIRTQIKYLSGGERARLALAKVLKRGGNFLILDEPTNDLDLSTLRLLEEAVAEFGGCVLTVSHDRYFLNRTCSGILTFEKDGKVVYTPGDCDYALEKHRERAAAAEAEKLPQGKKTPAPAEPVQTAKKEDKLTWKEARELEGMEAAIEECENAAAAIEEQFCQPDFYAKSGARQAELTGELERLRAKIAELYARWEFLESKKP